VPAAELGVGGDGEVALGAGGLFPAGPVGHGGGEDGFALAVGVETKRMVSGWRGVLCQGNESFCVETAFWGFRW
jgi:hypothetical protein